MMIATTCLLVTITILIHGQVGNSHVVTLRQATDSLKSGTPRSFSVGEGNDPLEIDEGSGIMETMLNVDECPGESQDFTILLPNPSGCYIFQTTGFDMEGYPNNTGSSSKYFCDYTIQFDVIESGTVTVKEKDFKFELPSDDGDCYDYVAISGVNDSNDNEIQYCGTITEDKIRDFSASEFFITLVADNTVGGNGAEIVICIN